MKIETHKDLQKIIQMCRKTGVSSIKIDGIEITLGMLPTKQVKSNNYLDLPPEALLKVPQYSPQPDVIENKDELSPEDLLFYSASGQMPSQQ